ncbi:MAG: aminotransferase class I/II-fold pyridoxal phosphate-dependent enzyme [Paracoccaceae bacterium]
MFHPFQVEQFLSENEQGVTYNFSESGVHPLTLGGLLELAGTGPEALSGVALDYPEVRGTERLRARIAALYPGAGPDNVLVTVGASEANHLIAATLLEPGDEMVAMRPTYQQLPGNARNAGIAVRTVPLVEEEGWALDTDALARAVGPKTRLIAIVNPNNPTGHVLTEDEMAAVVAAAARCGAWIVADEVYAGTERGGTPVTPGFWGRHDRVIAVNGLSKAYGLPGLRLGWLVAPGDQIPALWRRHEYATISASMLGITLAEIALDPAVRPKLTARARRLIDSGFDRLAAGLSHYQGVFSVVPPQASAMSFVRYNLAIGSRDLALRLRAEKDVLVVPGDCFGLEHHFRFSSALPEAHLAEGLERLNALVGELLED